MARFMRSACMVAVSLGVLSSEAVTTGAPSVYVVNSINDWAVQINAEVQSTLPQITLKWAPSSKPKSYEISRREKGDTGWTPLAKLPGNDNEYVDKTVKVGTIYEYLITCDGERYRGRGYIHSAIEAPLVEDRGVLLLVVDNTYAPQLVSELDRLKGDLIGDGWTVLRHDVATTDKPETVKSHIQGYYKAEPDLKAVFLFGHVPVPYSGKHSWDGHVDEHSGAWPADIYYADMKGTWTDTTVNELSPVRVENKNIPGDGKFDQDNAPGTADLAIGRVDFANMPVFVVRNEKELLKQYLNKDHQYRHKMWNVVDRAVIDDNLGTKRYPAIGAWRSFAPCVGIGAVEVNDLLSQVRGQSHLLAYGCGGGSYASAEGVGTSMDFAAAPSKAVFTMFYGSFFGDWDHSCSLLRAPLAAEGHGLSCSWSGEAPSWLYHPMGLGETLGYCTRLTQNADDVEYPTRLPRKPGIIHAALMGDPTLRFRIVAPATDLTIAKRPDYELRWTASKETVIGYHVYRAGKISEKFTRITMTPVVGTTYTDPGSSGLTYVYQVRAVKLESTPSGIYFNSSQGIFKEVAP